MNNVTSHKLKCRICGNILNNAIVEIPEKMYGTNEIFPYIHCSKCGCLQLQNENIDMSPYYPDHYLSLNVIYNPNLIKDYIGKCVIKYHLGHFSVLGFLANMLTEKLSQKWIKKGYFNFDSKILDVGCGSGRLLHLLYKRGFRNLQGIDPFNKQAIIYIENDVAVRKATIFDVTEHYDFIMLNYSLEHSPNPHSVIKKLINILNDNGAILVRIPILDCYSYKKYNLNWVQMDAPRHIYLYTIKSILTLCEEYGLICKELFYDSDEYQFIQSEKYERHLTYNDPIHFSKRKIREFRKLANMLNKSGEGDQVTMYFQKK
jgi:2-polyprenyl-3-methyl-5-hydroxy-6-metoxy-1,4-benzoquinol methylase